MVTRRQPPHTLRELELRAEALLGHRVADVALALGVSLTEAARNTKGFVGALLEWALGADADAKDGPDFTALGVELKSIPLLPSGRPAESTFVCSIYMAEADRETWESSRLLRRLRRVLFVPVQAARVAPLPDRIFGRAVFWQPTPAQFELLRADWEDIMGAIGSGHDARLSAHHGTVLQARPKAPSSHARTLAPGVDGPVATLPLGFYLRASFTAEILRCAGADSRLSIA